MKRNARNRRRQTKMCVNISVWHVPCCVYCIRGIAFAVCVSYSIVSTTHIRVTRQFVSMQLSSKTKKKIAFSSKNCQFNELLFCLFLLLHYFLLHSVMVRKKNVIKYKHECLRVKFQISTGNMKKTKGAQWCWFGAARSKFTNKNMRSKRIKKEQKECA